MYKIYKVTNLINGFIYIGITSQSIKQRINEHKSKNNSALYEPIKLYGFDNFKFEIIELIKTKKQGLEREEYWTLFYNSNHLDKGYNRAISNKKYGETNGFFNKKHNTKSIEQNMKSQKTRNIIFSPTTGKYYNSLRECERKTGINRTTIKRILDGVSKTHYKHNIEFIYEKGGEVLC